MINDFTHPTLSQIRAGLIKVEKRVMFTHRTLSQARAMRPTPDECYELTASAHCAYDSIRKINQDFKL